MTERLIDHPRKLGRPPIVTGERREVPWYTKLARSEFDEAESLPESSRANRLVALMNARRERDTLREENADLRDINTALEDVLSTLLDTCTNPARTSQEFSAAIDAARDALGREEERVR